MAKVRLRLQTVKISFFILSSFRKALTSPHHHHHRYHHQNSEKESLEPQQLSNGEISLNKNYAQMPSTVTLLSSPIQNVSSRLLEKPEELSSSAPGNVNPTSSTYNRFSANKLKTQLKQIPEKHELSSVSSFTEFITFLKNCISIPFEKVWLFMRINAVFAYV